MEAFLCLKYETREIYRRPSIFKVHLRARRHLRSGKAGLFEVGQGKISGI